LGASFERRWTTWQRLRAAESDLLVVQHAKNVDKMVANCLEHLPPKTDRALKR
jgi:hypothetical protein